MSTKLSFSHQISERRLFGKVLVHQEMIVEVDYDHSDSSVDNIQVSLFENGKFVAEISKLLDKAEGSPLAAMIEAIDWPALYGEHKWDHEMQKAEAKREEAV